MNKKIILTSVTTVILIALGLLLSHVHITIPLDSLVGYASVLMIAGVAVTDYRLYTRPSRCK